MLNSERYTILLRSFKLSWIYEYTEKYCPNPTLVIRSLKVNKMCKYVLKRDFSGISCLNDVNIKFNQFLIRTQMS